VQSYGTPITGQVESARGEAVDVMEVHALDANAAIPGGRVVGNGYALNPAVFAW
jgi:hypothetical protein